MSNDRQTLFFQFLLNKYHPTDRDEVTQCLSEEIRNTLFESITTWNDPSVLLKLPAVKIKNIHYSWFISILELYPEHLRPLFAAALPQPANHRLLARLKAAPETHIATTLGRQYLLSELVKKLDIDAITPIEHLSPSPLSYLLELSKEQLLELIDFLGLYDLAEEVSRIVDKNELKKIYSCLSIKKQHFLRSCLLSKEKVSVPKLELEKWNGEQEILERTLHKRGLVRLGKGLSGQSSDFIWHILHRMDIGRSQLLSRYLSSKEDPGITSIMIQGIQTVHNFFKKMGPE